MKNFLIRLFLVAVMLCDNLGTGMEAKAQGYAQKNEQKREGLLRQSDDNLKAVAEEPQSLLETVFRSAPASHRVASTRPTRLLPTHGGKPGKQHGRWVADKVNKHFRSITLQLCRITGRLCTVASPLRLYYVIALRRLLC